LTVSRALERLAAIWSKPASWLADSGAIVAVLAVGAAAAFAGAVHTRIFGHDIFVFLDAGWRVLNGQRPEIDFNPSMGPLLALLAALGMKLAGNSPDGIGVMSGIVGSVTGCWAYALGRKRMAWMGAALAAVVVALIAAAPFPIGWEPNTLSHAMFYNRFGYALLGLVVLESFRPGAATLAGGISTGIVAAALLFQKPSYGLVALGFAAGSALLGSSDRRRVLGIAAGLVGAVLAMMAYLRFDFGAVWSDLRMMSAARSAGLSFWNIRWAFLKGFAEFLPLGVLAALTSTLTSSLQPLAATALLWIGGALLLATNAQPSGFPLNAVLALILVERARATIKNDTPSWPRFPQPAAIVILLGLICCLPIAVSNAAGLADALIESQRRVPETVARFQSPILSRLILYDVPNGTDSDVRSTGAVYVTYVNDGVDLIRRVSAPNETIFTLDLVNPFPYALMRRPARGSMPALSFNHTFTDGDKPSQAWLYGSADIVMVPKHPASAEPDARALFRNYLPGIRNEMTLCAEDDWWELYRWPGDRRGCAEVSGPSRQSH
jgi:hypothetical protein